MSYASPVQITVSIDGNTAVVMPCDFLVVACDPRNLKGVCAFTPEENRVFSGLENYTFHTTLVKVPVPDDPAHKPEYGAMFSPEAMSTADGFVNAFRNETAKQFSLETANSMKENLVTVYQILGPRTPGSGNPPFTTAQFLNILNNTLDHLDWWPYPSFEICTDANGDPLTLTTPYFDHFDKAGIDAHMPWNYLGLQGRNNTVYVHASACFESVLQCWQYGGMLLDNAAALNIKLPADKAANIIVLGAGPSGMLFSHRLRQRGYTNVQILESTDRIGGKTRTVTLDAPAPPSRAPTPCELGTCYLSPAYDDMTQELNAFLTGNIRHGFYMNAAHTNPAGLSFRGVSTDKQFPGVTPPPPVIGYSRYVLMKGYYENNKPFKNGANWLDDFDEDLVAVETGTALAAYCLLVGMYVGDHMPMPLTPPQAFLDKNYSCFYDFLERNDLLILTGVFEYAYSVQGYGPLKKIPAYYGMIWMSVPLATGILEVSAGIKKEAAVSVLSKGWLDVWTQMAPTLNIQKKVKVMDIQR